MTGIPSDVRSLLICPGCRGELQDAREEAGSFLVCAACQVAYPVEEGIPVLLRDRGLPWTRPGLGE